VVAELFVVCPLFFPLVEDGVVVALACCCGVAIEEVDGTCACW